MTPTRCHRCGAPVAFVYTSEEQLVEIDAERARDGNIVLDGKASGHRVVPGAGSHRVHVCPEAGADEKLASGAGRS